MRSRGGCARARAQRSETWVGLAGSMELPSPVELVDEEEDKENAHGNKGRHLLPLRHQRHLLRAPPVNMYRRQERKGRVTHSNSTSSSNSSRSSIKGFKKSSAVVSGPEARGLLLQLARHRLHVVNVFAPLQHLGFQKWSLINLHLSRVTFIRPLRPASEESRPHREKKSPFNLTSLMFCFMMLWMSDRSSFNRLVLLRLATTPNSTPQHNTKSPPQGRERVRKQSNNCGECTLQISTARGLF